MTLKPTQTGYLALARSSLMQLRDEVPLIEVGLRVNTILDYLYYLDEE